MMKAPKKANNHSVIYPFAYLSISLFGIAYWWAWEAPDALMHLTCRRHKPVYQVQACLNGDSTTLVGLGGIEPPTTKI